MDNINLEISWLQALEDEFKKPYIQELKNFLLKEKQQNRRVLPQSSLWLNALNTTPLNQIKVVILGQDPYPTMGHAHGLCFSVQPHVRPLPKSLKNINIELQNDLGIDNTHTGYLEPWSKQGVLLLNAILTVEEGKRNSHQGKGWEIFTDKIIEIINTQCENVVFILWGNYAQKKGASIDSNKHYIIKSPHPSPNSVYSGFFGSKVFSKTNDYLKSKAKEPINWQL